MHQENRYGAVTQNCLGYAAVQEVRWSCPTVRRHHDLVGIEPPGGFENLRGGLTESGDGLHWCANADSVYDCGQIRRDLADLRVVAHPDENQSATGGRSDALGVRRARSACSDPSSGTIRVRSMSRYPP
jgi:hypothetical protein